MEIEKKYDILEVVGEGSFGRVYKAVDRETGQTVALKEIKNPDPSEYVQEIHALDFLEHPTIVSLKKVVYTEETVYLAMEYMEGSLHDLIRQRLCLGVPFSEAEVRTLSFQLFQGLDFMHTEGRFMHRDLKPANLLVNKRVLKISDLGAATQIDSRGPFNHYVTTRFYRAPEMLIRSYEKDERCRPFVYDEKVDMWAAGTILAELFMMFPLFRGESSAHQLQKICEVIGAPTNDSWMGRLMNIPKFEPENDCGLRACIPNASQLALDLIGSLLSWDPAKRPSAEEALQHPFYTKANKVEATSLGISNGDGAGDSEDIDDRDDQWRNYITSREGPDPTWVFFFFLLFLFSGDHDGYVCVFPNNSTPPPTLNSPGGGGGAAEKRRRRRSCRREEEEKEAALLGGGGGAAAKEEEEAPRRGGVGVAAEKRRRRRRHCLEEEEVPRRRRRRRRRCGGGATRRGRERAADELGRER
ncbi:hypothetical protein ACLB2K_052461 [Fragaria x ananassa]